ncbi:MAG: thioredoxin domain-containing protein [Patescibacteria group bacterium]
MKFSVPIIIGVIVLVLGIGYLATNSPSQAPVTTATPEKTVAPESSPIESPPVTESTTPGDVASVTARGTYTPYDAEKIAASTADHILLFFHATWCPSCRALEADIVAKAATIPAGVEIYKVDYDTATALKRKYGITTQHSIVEIDASGNAKSKVTHPLTLAGVLATI